MTSYSTLSPFSMRSIARIAAISRPSVRRQRALSLLVNAMETGWLMRRSPQMPAVSHGEQVPMKTTDDGDQVHPVLNFIGIAMPPLFGFVGAVGNGFCGHDRPPVVKGTEWPRLDKLANWPQSQPALSISSYSEADSMNGERKYLSEIWIFRMGNL